MTKPSLNQTSKELLGETAKIQWKDLQFFFASGKAIFVNPELDLIDVAAKISEDNASAVQGWMNKNQVIPVSDKQAKRWITDNATVWAVVVKPWVLVQDLKTRHV